MKGIQICNQLKFYLTKNKIYIYIYIYILLPPKGLDKKLNHSKALHFNFKYLRFFYSWTFVLKCVTKQKNIPSLSYCRSNTHSLHLSECMSPSLIPALYIEFGNSPLQNTTHLHRQPSYQSQFPRPPTSTRFGGATSTDRLNTRPPPRF